MAQTPKQSSGRFSKEDTNLAHSAHALVWGRTIIFRFWFSLLTLLSFLIASFDFFVLGFLFYPFTISSAPLCRIFFCGSFLFIYCLSFQVLAILSFRPSEFVIVIALMCYASLLTVFSGMLRKGRSLSIKPLSTSKCCLWAWIIHTSPYFRHNFLLPHFLSSAPLNPHHFLCRWLSRLRAKTSFDGPDEANDGSYIFKFCAGGIDQYPALEGILCWMFFKLVEMV